AQDRDDLTAGAAVDEDDEAEAELVLVGAVELAQLLEHVRVLVLALLRGGTGGKTRALTDRGVGVQRIELVGLAQLGDHVVGEVERVRAAAQDLDEARPAL